MTTYSREQVRLADAPPSRAAGSAPSRDTDEPPRPDRSWSRDHAIDLRLSIPLVFGRYYVTIVAGRERRNQARLVAERGKHPLWTAGNALLLAACGTIAGLAILFLMQTAVRLLFAAG